ncbi:MAG TPA: methyltransferase domain-containing protein, partial [Gammaproteobacteria bacterium]|nr:methyltransferase domain-containing protein [Gammaproteobacteria bacterium]
MNDKEVGTYWERNAPAWTALARAGYDLWRDVLNTPAFLEMLPPVEGLSGLDVGCGEGANTRTLAKRGAKLTAIDIAPAFVEAAVDAERREPLGIEYMVASAGSLPFANGAFDFATAFMSLMDVPGYAAALHEVNRVLRAGGFFQFSILHPCFFPPNRALIADDEGRTTAVQLRGYFERAEFVEQWTFGAAPPEERAKWPLFTVPSFHRTLGDYLNTMLDAGFAIERVGEPCPSDEVLRE